MQILHFYLVGQLRKPPKLMCRRYEWYDVQIHNCVYIKNQVENNNGPLRWDILILYSSFVK